VFSVTNAVLFRALPFTAPERLVWIASVRTHNPAAPFTLPEFLDYQSQTPTLSGIAAYANWRASLAGDTLPRDFKAHGFQPTPSTCWA
jgi:hypothetical protein